MKRKNCIWNNQVSRMLLLLIAFNPISSYGQTVKDTISYESKFQNFNRKINETKKRFEEKNDSLFVSFLKDAWIRIDAIKSTRAVSPKPEEQPAIEPISIDSTRLKTRRDSSSILPLPKKSNAPDAVSTYVKGQAMVEYFGSTFALENPDSDIPHIVKTDKENIARFYLEASHSEYVNSQLSVTVKQSESLKLNDWGIMLLLFSKASGIYSTLNEKTLFTWYCMLRNGYDIKVGIAENKIFMLVPSEEKLFTTQFQVGSRDYYLVNLEAENNLPVQISLSSAGYPGNHRQFSMRIKNVPQLEELAKYRTIDLIHPLHLDLNQNLIRFYQNYPPCELSIPFSAPFSHLAGKQLDEYFSPQLSGLNELQKVSLLLKFVQKGIRYQTDLAQFGHEKYLFAEETLFYGSADCEDRAVLLAQLVHRYTNLECICLIYPGHISLAINLPDFTSDKYFIYKGIKYYCCDPTYLNANCGMVIPRYAKVTPEILEIHN